MRIRLKARRKGNRQETPSLEISIKTFSSPFELAELGIKYGKFEAATALPYLSADFPAKEEQLQAVMRRLQKVYKALMERMEDDGK